MKQWHRSLKMREKERREIGEERKVGDFDETRGGKMAGELPFGKIVNNHLSDTLFKITTPISFAFK